MKLILEIHLHADDEQALHQTVSKFPVTIGRAPDNDVILGDPHIDPHHLRIDNEGGVLTVTDLQSLNGFTLNASMHKKPVLLKSGDTLGLGHAKIRVLAPDHPVPPALHMHKTHPALYWLSRPVIVWASFVLAIAVTMGWSFLEIWTDKPGVALAITAAVTVAIVAIWSAAWSVAGRLSHHKSNFRSQAALISLYMIAGTAAWYLEVYVDFLTNENWFSSLLTYGLNFILLALLIYGSLGFASRMGPRRQRVSALFFSGGIVAGVFLFSLISAKTFNQQPLYPATIEPYFSALARAETVDEFMKGNGRLFSSGEFAREEKAEKTP